MRFALAPCCLLCCAALPAYADTQYYGGAGAWFYDVKGSVSNNGVRLDFKKDLNLTAKSPGEVVLGFIPDAPRWFPAVEASYVRISTEGQQKISGQSVVFGMVPLTQNSVVATSAKLNNYDVSLRWGFPIGKKFRINGGFAVAELDGDVVVANQQTGAADRQPISEVFPLISGGLVWTPFADISLRTRFDYIQQGENKAQTAEASVNAVLWGPLALEAGYRQRRFKVVNNQYNFDSRLGGARAVLKLEF